MAGSSLARTERQSSKSGSSGVFVEKPSRAHAGELMARGARWKDPRIRGSGDHALGKCPDGIRRLILTDAFERIGDVRSLCSSYAPLFTEHAYPEYQALIGGQPAGRPRVEVKVAAPLAQPPGPGRVRGAQVRPPAPGLDRRGGRALGPRLVQHPGDPGRLHRPDARPAGPASRWRRSWRPPPPRPTAASCGAWPSRRSRPRKTGGTLTRYSGDWRSSASPVSSTSSRGHCSV